MPLRFNVVPEHSLQNEDCVFVLGMRLGQAMSSIKQCSAKIKNVHLIYSNNDPAAKDVVVDLVNDGLRLIFEPEFQRLKSIEVYDLHKIILEYGNEVFSDPSEPATIANVQQTFGATHPGVYDSTACQYVLQWTGLSFTFNTDKHPNTGPSQYAQGLSALQLPDGPSLAVNKLCIYSTSTDAACLPASALIAGEQVRVLSNANGAVQDSDGRRLNLSTKHISQKVYFGDHASSVVSALGAPCKVYYKGDDKMRIHRPSSGSTGSILSNQNDANVTHYFFNYFTLGLDILFDGTDDRVRKIVLHTNYPGHYDFGIYNRCNFELTLDDCSAKSSADSGKGSGKAKRVMWSYLSGIVLQQSIALPDDSQTSIDSAIQSTVRPVVMNRGSADVHTNDNPFPVTFCYGYGQCIFEVMTNGCLASVTLYDSESMT